MKPIVEKSFIFPKKYINDFMRGGYGFDRDYIVTASLTYTTIRK